jgi:hypothetical protein
LEGAQTPSDPHHNPLPPGEGAEGISHNRLNIILRAAPVWLRECSGMCDEVPRIVASSEMRAGLHVGASGFCWRLAGCWQAAQLRHHLLSKEPYGFLYPGTGNSPATVELQDTLLHRGGLLLQAVPALTATDLLQGLRVVIQMARHSMPRRLLAQEWFDLSAHRHGMGTPGVETTSSWGTERTRHLAR